MGVEKAEVVSSKLLEEIWNEIPPAINAKLVHKDINVFTPKNQMIFNLRSSALFANHVIIIFICIIRSHVVSSLQWLYLDSVEVVRTGTAHDDTGTAHDDGLRRRGLGFG